MTAAKRILVPVDFSPMSQAVLEYASLLAQPLPAAITLLHVYEPPAAMSGIVPGADDRADLLEERTQATTLLARMLEVLKGLGCAQAQMLIEEGFAVETILRVARDGKFDLIAMATHGRTGLDRVLMGSVVEGVWRKAPCVVLTVHIPHPSHS